MTVDLILFLILAAVAIATALGMLLSRNAVYSALFLVLNFATVAVFYLLLGAPFIALTQVTVYAGAIMVLFLFVIMLLNLGHDYERDLKGGVFSIISFATVGAMAGVLQRQFRGAALPDAITTGGASIDAALAEFGVVGAIAEPLYTTYVVAFEITGILLLVAIVGALVLAKRSPA